MRVLVLILGFLLFAMHASAQIDTASYEEFDVYKAKEESVLISYQSITVENSAEGEDPRVITIQDELVFFSTVTKKVEAISHKDELPFYEDILHYGNGEVVNYCGSSYVLTTKHVIEDLKRNDIIEVEGSEIVLIKLDTLYECAPELLDKGITTGKASFGCIHPMGTDYWKYIVISDTIFVPRLHDFFFTDSVLEIEIDKFCDTLDLDLPENSIRFINFFHTELFVQSNNLKVIKDEIKKAVNARKEPFMEFCKNTVVMRVDSELYKKLPGSSGSILFAEDGVSIVGVLWGGMTSAGEDRHYIRFDLISQIMEALEASKK